MSLFKWFLGQSATSKNTAADNIRTQRINNPSQAQNKQLQPAGRSTTDAEAQVVDRKVKRHARREQLYVAIRECMTRAGVLSASYKFKVLSLDQQGQQFLVMMDVAPGLGGQVAKLTDIETLMISTAKNLFSIYVTSVYWRTDNRPVAASAVNFGVSQPAALESRPTALDATKNTPPTMPQNAASRAVQSGAHIPNPQRYEPINDDEVAAFKQALSVASTSLPATPDSASKSRSGLRSFTLITGFEDTEMPDSATMPALSGTQYGDLN